MAATMIVHWSANAAIMLAELSDYLTNVMGEYAADNYLDELIAFGNAIAQKGEHFSFCRNLKLQALDCRCATFRKKYVVVFKIVELQVNILGVIHVSRGPDAFHSII